MPGRENSNITERVKKLQLADFSHAGCPVIFWDIIGDQGHPVRATVSEMGPLWLSRLLNLNETQAGVLTLIFKISDDNGLLLLDMKDLQAVLQYVGDHAKEFQTQYGNISAASVGAIQRGLLGIEQQGGQRYFGEPALNLDDMMQTDSNGHGIVSLLAADKLIQAPRVYATFLLWLLTELFERLPEVGDPEKPRLVLFFDEAHLLFADLPKVIEQKVQQIVRLIRSKGVGVYFVTQNPLDVPEEVLGQLGNRVQHALRHSRRRIRNRFALPPTHSARTRSSILRTPSPNWRWVRHSSHFSMRRDRPAWLIGLWCVRREVRSVPSRLNSGSRS